MREDAEAATEDALRTAARGVDSIPIGRGLWFWIFRLTARAAYETLRTRRRGTDEITLDDLLSPFDDSAHFVSMEDWSNRVDAAALQGDLHRVGVEAIGVLPPDYRAVLVLHDIEGTADAEIAEALGMSLLAVTSRVHRSRLFVRKRLSEHLEAA